MRQIVAIGCGRTRDGQKTIRPGKRPIKGMSVSFGIGQRGVLVAMAAALTVVGWPTPATSQGARCLGQQPTITGTNTSETITGTDGDDVIAALGGDDVINGLAGNDRICGDAGIDTIDAGEGNDGINGGEGADVISFASSGAGVRVDLFAGEATGQGSDRLFGLERVWGSPRNDELRGDEGRNELRGEAGNDALLADAGFDVLSGGTGDDVFEGGSDNDVATFATAPGAVDIDLGAGTGTGEGADNFAGVEAVVGSEHNDVIEGDERDNYLFGRGGNDEIVGAGGYDYAVFWFAPNGVDADLADGTAKGEGNDSLAGISGLVGSPFDDVLTGDPAANYLDGGDGGNDVLVGADGDDLFVGRGGEDTYDGGAGGFDRIDFRAAGPIEVDLRDRIATGEGTDALNGIEGVGGTKSADVLNGDGATNYLVGRGGRDEINAFEGDDFLNGGPGSDRGNGGPGKDACKSFERGKPACERKTDTPEHPLQKSVDTTESYRRNF